MIGSFGPVVFEASMRRLRTFDDFKRSGSSRWATHEIMGCKPVREFLGPGEEKISLSVKLDVAFGINPGQEIEVLRQMRDAGEAMPIVLGGKPISENLWVIEDMTESWTRLDNHGRLLAVGIELTLAEYVPKAVV